VLLIGDQTGLCYGLQINNGEQNRKSFPTESLPEEEAAARGGPPGSGASVPIPNMGSNESSGQRDAAGAAPERSNVGTTRRSDMQHRAWQPLCRERGQEADTGQSEQRRHGKDNAGQLRSVPLGAVRAAASPPLNTHRSPSTAPAQHPSIPPAPCPRAAAPRSLPSRAPTEHGALPHRPAELQPEGGRGCFIS